METVIYSLKTISISLKIGFYFDWDTPFKGNRTTISRQPSNNPNISSQPAVFAKQNSGARRMLLYNVLHFSINSATVPLMKIIANIITIAVMWSHVSFSQERISPVNRIARDPSRDGRGTEAERLQLNENGSPRRLSDSLLLKKKPVEGGALSEIRKAQRVSDADRTQEESAASPSSIPLPNTMDGLNDKRPLSIGDRLSFKVVEDEGGPRTLSVTDSAEIDVPYIGRVPAGNRTCKQFAYYIKKLLEKEYYYQATVIIGLDAAGIGARAASRGRVYVMGQVRSSGAQDIPVDETYTVSKAILRAGGFGPYANKRKVKVVRGGKNGSNSKPIYVDCVEIIEKGHWDKDVEIGPDDIITVIEKWINIF